MLWIFYGEAAKKSYGQCASSVLRLHTSLLSCAAVNACEVISHQSVTARFFSYVTSDSCWCRCFFWHLSESIKHLRKNIKQVLDWLGGCGRTHLLICNTASRKCLLHLYTSKLCQLPEDRTFSPQICDRIQKRASRGVFYLVVGVLMQKSLVSKWLLCDFF